MKKFLYFFIQIFTGTYYFFIAGSEIAEYCAQYTYSFIAKETYFSATEKAYAENNPGNFIEFSLNIPEKDKNYESFASQATGSSSTLYFKKKDNDISMITVYENNSVTENVLEETDYRLPVLDAMHCLINFIHDDNLDYKLILPSLNNVVLLFSPLPNELTLNILNNLSLVDLMQIRATTNTMKTVIDNNIKKLLKHQTHLIDIIKQIFSDKYLTSYYLLPTKIFRLLFHMLDSSWAITLFIRNEECPFTLENGYIKYVHEKKYTYNKDNYNKLVYACFPKHIAMRAFNVYTSHETANILDWHIKNSQNNVTELKKWIDGANIIVNINGNEHQVNGVLLYETCFKNLWDYAKKKSYKYLGGCKITNPTYYTFYYQLPVFTALLKVLKYDHQNGLIDEESLINYLKLMIENYKELLDSSVQEFKINEKPLFFLNALINPPIDWMAPKAIDTQKNSSINDEIRQSDMSNKETSPKITKYIPVAVVGTSLLVCIISFVYLKYWYLPKCNKV